MNKRSWPKWLHGVSSELWENNSLSILQHFFFEIFRNNLNSTVNRVRRNYIFLGGRWCHDNLLWYSRIEWRQSQELHWSLLTAIPLVDRKCCIDPAQQASQLSWTNGQKQNTAVVYREFRPNFTAEKVFALLLRSYLYQSNNVLIKCHNQYAMNFKWK